MNPEVQTVQVGDKKVASGATPPKLDYVPSEGDYRASQQRSAEIMKESQYNFQDLKLPDQKNLLDAVKQISNGMKNQDTDGAHWPMQKSGSILGRTDISNGIKSQQAVAPFGDGELLSVMKTNGHVTGAAIIRPDGSSDAAGLDDHLDVKWEALTTPLGSDSSMTKTTAVGSHSRDYKPDGALSTEKNDVMVDGRYVYRDKLEFDGKGNITHLHSETPSDSTDDARLPDGSGRRVIVHKDSDPNKVFVDTRTVKPDGSVVEDWQFGYGDYKHLETDAQGLKRLDSSDIKKGVIDRQQRQQNGLIGQFTDFLI